MRDLNQFDLEHRQALRRIWFLGDVHGEFRHIAQTLLSASERPRWLVFLGDIDIDHQPLRELLAPLSRWSPEAKVLFIHGNHDADTAAHWAMLHDCGDAEPLHRRVVHLDGVRVAGLGGNFLGRIWCPPGEAVFASKVAAMTPGPLLWLDPEGRRPNSMLHAAIYPDDLNVLSRQRADILVTHEAPSCHPHGFETLDQLARSLGVVRTFHGHHHDDRSEDYPRLRESLGFDARAVAYCGIKNGLGEVILPGEAGW
ncbi:MAG: metallophosphoesterase [Rhodoferax sp.]|nr:metallophosphoesterase [Rhodoferax sp.]